MNDCTMSASWSENTCLSGLPSESTVLHTDLKFAEKYASSSPSSSPLTLTGGTSSVSEMLATDSFRLFTDGRSLSDIAIYSSWRAYKTTARQSTRCAHVKVKVQGNRSRFGKACACAQVILIKKTCTCIYVYVYLINPRAHAQRELL